MFFCHDLQKIPPNFLKYLDENMRNAILTGSSGDQWQVTVLKNGNDKYLQNGWPQFVRDNSVMHQEFLLFTYNGENRFQVQIFRRNGCERPSSKKLKLKQEAAATPSVVRAKRGRGRPRKTPAASIR